MRNIKYTLMKKYINIKSQDKETYKSVTYLIAYSITKSTFNYKKSDRIRNG